jgi:hypothetical protein
VGDRVGGGGLVGEGLGDDVGGGEQHRALGDGVLVGEGQVAEGQAEEAGEPEGLDTCTGGLEVAAEHLGAHVDAEHRLQRRAGVGRGGGDGGGALGQEAHHAPLGGAVVGVLEEQVEGERLVADCGPDRVRQAGPGAFPGRRDGGVRGRPPDAEFPAQQHCGELHRRVVLLAGEAGVPRHPGGEGGPAADPQQQGVHERQHRLAGDPELVECHRGGGHRVVGEGPHGGAEPLEAHDVRGAVEGGVGLPGGEQRAAGVGRAPEGLTPVEVGGGPGRDPVGAQPRPVAPGRRRRQLRGHQDPCGGELGGRLGEGQELGGGGGVPATRPQGGLDVDVLDQSAVVSGAVEGRRHRGVGTGGLGQRQRGLLEGVVEQPQVGVHRYEALEGPERGDAPACGLQGRADLVEVVLVDGGAGQFHVGSMGAGEAVVRGRSSGSFAGGSRSSTVAGAVVGLVRRAPMSRS